MCNFTPLICKGRDVECVVCEGTGNGMDGFYDEVSPAAMLDDTMSFVSRKNRFSQISSANRGGSHDHDARRDAASREVGRRILSGWQLLESPCSSCQMPLMSEAYGTPEICIFCDPNENAEFDVDDVPDDVSVSSRQSITLEIPEGFDPSDPNAMAELVARATSSVKSGSVRGSVSPRNRIPGSVGGGNRIPGSVGGGNRIPGSVGGGQRSVSRTRGRAAPLPPSPRMRSQSPSSRPTPESRNALPSMRRSRGRSSPAPRRTPGVYISTDDFDDDEASQLSDDVSVARSVASHTLDAILSKIEDCKSQLNKPIDDDDVASIAQNSAAVSLIEKLAAAAVAVKLLEANA